LTADDRILLDRRYAEPGMTIQQLAAQTGQKANVLRATVPPQATGFTIRSPKLDLVDRGTEFGLDVTDGGKTDVHVFQGKVELYEPGGNKQAVKHRDVTTGQGVRLGAAGGFRAIELNPAGFVTSQDL